MEKNLLLLELHWLKDNRANLIFQNTMNGSTVKIKRMKNALWFVGSLAQQYFAFNAGASHTDELILKNNDEDNTWVFHSSFVKGIVSIMLLFNTRKNTDGFHKVFFWSGALSDFRYSINRFKECLPKYPFFDKVIALGKRLVDLRLPPFENPTLLCS